MVGEKGEIPAYRGQSLSMTPVQVGRARARDLDLEGVYGDLWESSYRSKPSQVVEENNLLFD